MKKEEIEAKVRTLATLKFWKLPILAFGIGLICHLAFAWSFWAVALAVIFCWIAEQTSQWLYVPAVAIIGWALFTSFFPITASKVSWGNLSSDLFIGQKVDSVQVKADLILEGVKNYKKDALLGQYTDLLKAGKVEKAKRLLDSIDNLYYPEEPVVIQQPPVQPPVVVPPTQSSKDSIFTKGIYFININGKTPFIINVRSDQTCRKYALASQTGNGYDIVWADGTAPTHDAPNMQVVFPNKENPRFELASNQLTTVRMVVN
ncbi:MAG: hypothetical protein WCT50_00700 [Patescibacteria group bacterium]